jgi:hypothetical protein
MLWKERIAIVYDGFEDQDWCITKEVEKYGLGIKALKIYMIWKSMDYR